MMSISDQGWAAITAYEMAGAAASRERGKAVNLTMNLMVEHLYRDHGMSVYQIAKKMKIKRVDVHRILERNEED